MCGLLVLYFSCFKHLKYQYALNKTESIKYYEQADKAYAYHRLSLTPTEYYSTLLANSMVIKAIYKNDTIGFKITKPRFKDEIYFKSIGKESDRFVKAISELYEENSNDNSMRPEMKSSFLIGGGVFDWNKDSDNYKIVITALNGKDAEMYLNIDIPNHTVFIGDKNNGLSKQRFVNAFRVKETDNK